MSQPEQAKLFDHEYDGIREFDNPIPGWWNWIWAATTAFSIVYAFLWHASRENWTVENSWQIDQVLAYRRVFGQMGDLTPDQETILKMMNDPQMMNVAKSMYQGNCVACHAKDGGGINGVNLTDDHYKNVGKLEDLFTTITKGANSGAMPAWEQRMQQNERIIMAAYVASLRGTHPANPRAPEGSPIPPWPTASKLPASELSP